MKKYFKTMLCVVLASMTVLSGCSGSSTSSDNETANESTSAVQNSQAETSQVEEGGGEPKTVRINTYSEPDSLDPWMSAATDTESIFLNVFEGLVGFDEEGAVTAKLAKDWVISEDNLTYTFHLRDDVTFHNGKPLTAEDVIYTYENLAGLNGREAISSKFQVIESIEAEDDYTVSMHLSEVNAAFLEFTKVAVLPKDYSEQATAPIGTGPFRFVEYVPGQRVVLEKNEDYYDKEHMPSIDRAEVYIMTDESAVVTALQSGQLDAANVSPENAAVLEGDFDIYTSPQNMVQIFALNNTVEPFTDKRVRQALSYVVDKQQIIDGAFGGYATMLYSNFSPVMGVYYNDQLADVYSVNIEKAKELLTEAGYPDGFSMVIKVPANYRQHVDTAQILAEQLKQVNVQVEIQPIEWGTWLEDVYTNAQYQATIVGLTGKLDPNDILGRYTSGYKKNFFKYSNPDYDALIDKALQTTDEAERAEYYKECQRILTEDAAAIWTCDPNLTIACRKDLKGYTFYPIGFIDFSKMYYEE
ncbi:MAG: ABC transporter substrate-binding protein [bacterium]|nr:ABC transporter substrate-binding protein [bacterium]